MIRTYYINVTQFEDDALFLEKRNLLSPYRQQKIAMLKHERDKCRSLGAGVALDYALRKYGLDERSMEYESGRWGKPALKYHPDLHFSLSHSGEYALCSVGDHPIGNDVERIRPGRLKVADRFYAPEELEFLYAVQEEVEITRRMFRIWTMKESFLKVTGRGIYIPMGEFSVISEEKRGTVDAIKVRQTFDSAEYYLKEYTEIPGYGVSVCCQGSREFAGFMELVL